MPLGCVEANGPRSILEARSSRSTPQTKAAASEKVVRVGCGSTSNADVESSSEQPSSIKLAPEKDRRSIRNVLAATAQLSDIVHSIGDRSSPRNKNKRVKFGEPLVPVSGETSVPAKRPASRRTPILKHISACRDDQLVFARPESEVLPDIIDDVRRSDEFIQTEAKIKALEKHSRLLEAAIKAMLMTRVNTVVNTEIIDYTMSSYYPMDLPSNKDFMDSLRLEVAC